MHVAATTRFEDITLPPLVTNGVVGLRVPPFAALDAPAVEPGRCTVNGLVHRPAAHESQGWAAAPYPLAWSLRLDGRPLADVRFSRQAYDFATGELTTRLVAHAAGVSAELTVTTFASRTWPHVVCQTVEIIADRATPAEFVSEPGGGHDLIERSCLVEPAGRHELADVAFCFETRDGLSRLGLARTSAVDDPDARTTPGRATGHAVRLAPGRPVRLVQMAALVPSCCHDEPELQAVRLLGQAVRWGIDALRQANHAAWAEMWRGRVIIDGPAPAQRVADACFFHLHASFHPSMPHNSGLLGLGMHPAYHMFRGHAFWDVETFVLPALSLTDPASARRVIEQRHEQLPAARSNARMNGYRGAQFPWESGTTGHEVTGVGWPKVFCEHHVSLDVALAAARVAHVTGDAAFTRERCWPILRDVAEWVTSRVVHTARGYEIRDVCGIDEGRPYVDNNAWTNASAVRVLQEAAAAARQLGIVPPASWNNIAAAVHLPVRDGVLLKYDGQPDEPGLCPDPSACFFPLDWRPADPQLESRTLRYFLDRRAGYLGYPMLSSPMFAWAARLGERQLSAELFEQGVADFVFGPFDQIDEFGRNMTEGIKARVGPYLAHCGGALTGLLLGLPRLVPNSGEVHGWCEAPAILPAGWEAVRAERLHARGRPMRLMATHGVKASLTEA